MRIESFVIQGFRSIAEPLELSVGTMAPGLYHVVGQNLVEPALEGNGVGKSSLFEALFWLLHGRTSRGLRAGAVQNWYGSERCAGQATVTVPAGTVEVFRSWQPNALEVDGRPVTDEELQQVLGLSPDMMLYAIYFAQFTRAFIDLKPNEQTELFTNVLQLHVWETAAERAADGVKRNAILLNTMRARLAGLQGQAEELLAQDFTAAVDAWEAQRTSEIARYEAEAASLSIEVRKKQAAANKHLQNANTFRQRRAVEMEAAKALVGADATLTAAERALHRLHAQLRESPKNCPTCGQAIKNDSKADVHLKGEIGAAELAITHATKAVDVARAHHEESAKAMVEFRQAEVDYSNAMRQVAAFEARRDEQERQAQHLRLEKNPHKAQADAAEQRGMQLADDIEKLEAEVQAAEHQLAACEFWVKGFKEVRLSQIRESLAQLQIEANEALYQLGLRDWQLLFDVERETKSGTISAKFQTMVVSPHHDQPVPWEAWSGGESQRLRLSAAMGFANLVCGRAGVQPNVELWDEPSQWLSQAGINDLLQTLADRAQRLKKVILLADHRSLDFGGFAGILRLVKDAKGTRMVSPV